MRQDGACRSCLRKLGVPDGRAMTVAHVPADPPVLKTVEVQLGRAPASAVEDPDLRLLVKRRIKPSCKTLTWIGLVLVLGLGCALIPVLLLSQTHAAASEVDVLFLLHDAGESLSVQRTIAVLAGSFQLAVFALGEPSITIFADAPNVTTLSPRDLGITQRIVDGSERNATLEAADVSRVLARFGSPHVVVAGMAYEMQAQLARAFREAGSHAVGIDDGIAADRILSARSVRSCAPRRAA